MNTVLQTLTLAQVTNILADNGHVNEPTEFTYDYLSCDYAGMKTRMNGSVSYLYTLTGNPDHHDVVVWVQDNVIRADFTVRMS